MLGSEARKECFWAGDLKVGVVNGPPSLALALLGWEKQMKALVASSAAAILKSCFYCLSFLLSLSLRIMLRPQWTILKALGLPCWRAKMHTTSEKAERGGKKANYKLPHNVLKDPTAERWWSVDRGTREECWEKKGHKRPPSFPF